MIGRKDNSVMHVSIFIGGMATRQTTRLHQSQNRLNARTRREPSSFQITAQLPMRHLCRHLSRVSSSVLALQCARRMGRELSLQFGHRRPVFQNQLLYKIGNREHLLDRPDALLASPYMFPCLDPGRLTEVHRGRIALRKVVRIEAGTYCRGPKIVAVNTVNRWSR